MITAQINNEKQLAEANVARWLRLRRDEFEIKKRIKETEDELREYAIKHREEFSNKSTMRLGKLKLIFFNKGKIVTSDKFELSEFSEEYPECIEFTVKLSKLKEFTGSEKLAKEIEERYGLTVQYTEGFKLEKAESRKVFT